MAAAATTVKVGLRNVWLRPFEEAATDAASVMFTEREAHAL